MTGWSMGRAFVVAAAVGSMAIALAGCSRGGPAARQSEAPTASASPAETWTPASDTDRSRKFVAKVNVEGTGDAAFTWDGQQEIVLTRLGKQGLDVNFLSAGFALPQIVTNDRSLRFRWAFDLLNAYTDQPGTYTIDGVPQGDKGLRSSAFLIFYKAKDPSMGHVYDLKDVEFYRHFDQMRQPCSLELGEQERTGSVRCPELATKDGEITSLLVRWEQTGPNLPSD